MIREGAQIPSRATTHSEEPLVEIFIFACGRGDTILVHLPGDRWALIDCYLTADVKGRFFDFLRHKGINSLAFVFLTHPHYDRFFGMAEVLQYFNEDGRSVENFCDIGLDPKRIKSLLRGLPGESEYARLQHKLEELDRIGTLKFYELGDTPTTLCVKGFEKQMMIVPIAPDTNSKRRILNEAIRKAGCGQSCCFDPNILSMILVLTLNIDSRRGNILFCADAGKEQIDNALDYWGSRTDIDCVSPLFHVVKVPHHGSFNSHSPRLVSALEKEESPCFAAISTDSRMPGLPSKSVIQDYLQKGWTVLITGKRVRTSLRTNRLLGLLDRSCKTSYKTQMNDILISWNTNSGFANESIASSFFEDDLDSYE